MQFRLLLLAWMVACDGGSVDQETGCSDGVDCAEDCVDQVDNDGDGATDCEDADCDGKCWEICDDTRDNDGDGFIDCEDDDCVGQCPEDCFDGEDNDGDGLIDCADIDCTDFCAEDCTDGKDNDGDGAVDCEDPECDGGCPEACDDGRDNDGDGAVDCADIDCTDVCAEDCTDGIDNDADGLIDCDDVECTDVCAEDCTDGKDNDGDGAVDCEDPECDGGCPEACDDGRDNDGDGLVDCEDADCVGADICMEVCDDTIDNDVDGLTDCEDDDCWGKECHPDGTQARAISGTMNVYSQYLRSYRSSSCGAGAAVRFRDAKAGVAYDVKGTVKAKPLGATTWVTCDFSADTVSFGYTTSIFLSGSSFGYFSGYKPVYRHNFKVEDKCALGDDWFLPQGLIGSSGAALTDKGLYWYQGTINSTTQTSTYESGTSCSSYYSMAQSSWDVTLGSGELYLSK